MSTLFRTCTAVVGLALGLVGCEHPKMDSVQTGIRGIGMEEVINPRLDAAKYSVNQLPAALPAAPADGPAASAVYQNIQVLKDLNVAQFTRVMLAITQWVAPPDQSCNYCHGSNMASDDKYTKVVARRMLEMTRHINSDWTSHVAQTGVTCYTCHRGNAVPQNVWFTNPGQSSTSGLTAGNAGKNSPTTVAGLSSLPYDPYTPFLLDDKNIRVIANDALPGGDRSSIKQTDYTYSLMMSMSQSLGVNCVYCHNSRSFAVWDASTPKRTTAWYGIRMARDLNNHYLVPLTATFPAHRLGVLGDVAKINCATCHQGVFKPLYGESMAKDYPELVGALHPVAATPAPVDAAPVGRLYFDVDKSDKWAEGGDSLESVVAYLKAHEGSKASISGYNDPSGNAQHNLQLAKARAIVVRKALVADGITVDRVSLDKPMNTTGSGDPKDARRVEVTVQP
jgi:photosynthetic reaction center cytochrome c subunit